MPSSPKKIAGITYTLLSINVLMFIATFGFEHQEKEVQWDLGLFYPGSPQFETYQIVTYLFMHGSFAHLFFNMAALVMFGVPLEKIWGAKKFLLYYFVAGLGGTLLHSCVNGLTVYSATGTFFPDHTMIDSAAAAQQVAQVYFTPAIGASSAIYGVLLAFGMLFPNTALMLIFFPVPIKAKYCIPLLILVELYLGVQSFAWDNFAHFAHLGGALFGCMLVLIWKRDRTSSQ